MRPFEVLPTISEPLNGGDDDDDREGDYAVVHVVAGYGQLGWENEEDCSEDGVRYTDLHDQSLAVGIVKGQEDKPNYTPIPKASGSRKLL